MRRQTGSNATHPHTPTGEALHPSIRRRTLSNDTHRPRANGTHRPTVPRHSQRRRRQTAHTRRQTLARHDRHRNGRQNRPCGRGHSSNGPRPTRQLRLGRCRHRRNRRSPHSRTAGRPNAASTATTSPPPTRPDDITPVVATGRAGRVSTRPAHSWSWTGYGWATPLPLAPHHLRTVTLVWALPDLPQSILTGHVPGFVLEPALVESQPAPPVKRAGVTNIPPLEISFERTPRVV